LLADEAATPVRASADDGRPAADRSAAFACLRWSVGAARHCGLREFQQRHRIGQPLRKDCTGVA
jgi:hypothetical protein